MNKTTGTASGGDAVSHSGQTPGTDAPSPAGSPKGWTLADRLKHVPTSRLRARLRLAHRILQGDEVYGPTDYEGPTIAKAEAEVEAIEAELKARGDTV